MTLIPRGPALPCRPHLRGFFLTLTEVTLTVALMVWLIGMIGLELTALAGNPQGKQLDTITARSELFLLLLIVTLGGIAPKVRRTTSELARTVGNCPQCRGPKTDSEATGGETGGDHAGH